MKILVAAALYFAIVFGVGFLVGPVRVFYVEPRVGATVAVLLEAPILLVAMVVGAKIVLRWINVSRRTALFAIGVVALFMQQAADIAVGVLLRGMSIGDHMRQFSTPEGMIYGMLLLAFTLMPCAMGQKRTPYSRSTIL
jgi:hypothetical protein